MVLDAGDAEASLADALAAALEANRQLADMAGELREENTRLREDNATDTPEISGRWSTRCGKW